jgi:hypothetical protein
MRAVTFEVIDGIKIVRAIGEPTIDPELTRREIRERLERSDEYRAFDRAYLVCSGLVDASPSEIEAAKTQLLEGLDPIVELRNSITEASRIYFYVPGEANVADDYAEQLLFELAELKPRELLAIDGEVIADERGRRAWTREGERWEYLTIARLGEQLPDGYRWHEDLSPEELDEVRAQMDRERIEAMSEDERRARAMEEIDAALDSLVQRHMRAQIRGDDSALAELRGTFESASARIFQRYNLSEVQDGERTENIERAADG